MINGITYLSSATHFGNSLVFINSPAPNKYLPAQIDYIAQILFDHTNDGYLVTFIATQKYKPSLADNDISETPKFDDLPLLEPINIDAESDTDDWSKMEMPDLEDLSEMIDEDDEVKESKDKEEIVNVFKTLMVEEQEHWKEQAKPLCSALFKVCC